MLQVLVHQENTRRGMVVTIPMRLPRVPNVGETIQVEGEPCIVESRVLEEGHPIHLTVRVLSVRGYGD
ncbi:MAG: hypothetical protein M3220_18685 [Chloroflexota bacterium]|nr:hypothetical protein [Chloroflexota bacterium]